MIKIFVGIKENNEVKGCISTTNEQRKKIAKPVEEIVEMAFQKHSLSSLKQASTLINWKSPEEIGDGIFLANYLNEGTIECFATYMQELLSFLHSFETKNDIPDLENINNNYTQKLAKYIIEGMVSLPNDVKAYFDHDVDSAIILDLDEGKIIKESFGTKKLSASD
ncbi:hypothetical protein [Paenibacillus agricola]|uniref:Uncharacterized protein n=1 Tax=Paenibacillus agricola TaxID=2716264 RepID=A0ABX0JBI3_9BACL|nr:hypothetical protein [Paenibacillus agricola]NHN33308.1 hypothetical protein [Paenibacillus agricola]